MTRAAIVTVLMLCVASGCRANRAAQRVASPEAPRAVARKKPVAEPSQAVAADEDEPEIQRVSSQSGAAEPSGTNVQFGITDQSGAAEPAQYQSWVPGSALSLRESITLGLSQNPDLIAQRQAENVAVAALGVAQTYPFNPFIQAQATPWQDAKQGGPGTTYHYVLLMQTIQLAHQQQYRSEGGAFLLNSTRWTIHQAELLNVAQTERLYFTALYQKGIWELARASHDNNMELLRALEKQLDAGHATAADVAIVRIDANSTRQQLRMSAATYETALRDLRRQIGIEPRSPVGVTGKLSAFAWKLPTAQPTSGSEWGTDVALPDANQPFSVASWAGARPDVMAARSDIDVAGANLSLATASKTPDLQIGPYYQRTADGTSFYGLRAHMEIPIINSGRPLEDQRRAEHNQRVMTWQQLLERAELEADAAFDRYRYALESLAEDEPQQTTDVPEELRSLERQFLAGEVDVIRVVQARTSIIQNQRARLDLFNEAAQSAANLTAAAGIPLESLLAAP